MTIDQLVIYREKIRSVSVPEAVHYLLGEIDRFMDENARLTAEVERLKGELTEQKQRREYHADERIKEWKRAEKAESKLSRYEAALNRLASCEDDSSWGDWVRDVAREALETGGCAKQKGDRSGCICNYENF